jgi:NAD(P)-dependent dehydrogenase (short-subunit alcohol dehydrogenase family)
VITSLITGGGRGIGRAIALALAEPERHVIVAGRHNQALVETAAEIERRGARATTLQMDVTNEQSVSAGFASLQATGCALDVLVNNAGTGGGQPVQDSDVGRWRNTIDVNVVGMYLVTRAALPTMSVNGRIINMSSVLGRFGVPGYTAYCAAKHAVIGFTRALALELAPRGITVNALSPGWVDTEMARQGMRQGGEATGTTYAQFRERALEAVPIKRMIQPEEVARLVRFLIAAESSAITGQTYNICGGQTMD